MNNDIIDLSVIIPAYNERKTLEELYRHLTETLAKTAKSYEIIFINDGSTDKSLQILKELRNSDNKIKIIDFSRNMGQQTALAAGIDYSSGKAVILMDADLQDSPNLIIKMIKEWENGNDVVYAIRKKRQENPIKKLCYKSFYSILNKLSEVEIPSDSGDFSLMDRKVVDAIKDMPERNMFVRGMRSWVGFKQIGIGYDRDKRYADKSKYSFIKLLKLASDGIFSFSVMPLRIASVLGLLLFVAGILSAAFQLYLKLFTNHSVEGVISVKTLLLLLGGLQISIIGLVGEYVGRIYEETKKRPRYIIKNLYGFN